MYETCIGVLLVIGGGLIFVECMSRLIYMLAMWRINKKSNLKD